MTKKSNVHPDHYKTGGRDRPDDAAAARLNRAIVAKMASREDPDRMTKKFYFERPEPPGPGPGAPEAPARPMKKRPHAAGSARKEGPRKATTTKRVATTRKAGEGKAARSRRQAAKKSGSGRRAKRPSARPTGKR